MDDGQEQDHYEERLKEVFNSFDTSGCGSLSPEELSDLCQSLHLDDATPVLLHTLLQNQDHLTARVDFDQFKNALILVLSSTIESPQEEQEALPKPESPEVQPKFVKGSKRYGRRSTPEFIEPVSDLSDLPNTNAAEEEDLEDNYDSAVPRKRERWNVHESSSEEYEADGQMHLWNPDEPSTPRGSILPLSAHLEERLCEACEELEIPWDGCAGHAELLALCEHLGLELNGDVLLSLTGDGAMNVQVFVSRVVNYNKPPTPSASTPYRQLKRHHSTQPFDEGGRRISALPSSIGMRLFSTLDDGTGFTPAEYILDAWIDEGIENSAEILQALHFDVDGKLSLSDLTTALENELLVTKNGFHQAALASFKAEIRYLLERVDREIREKEKIQLDLERAEKQKTQLAAEVDEHHTAIEHRNNLNLRKLEQEYKEKLSAVRSELMKEMDQIQQQASLQREDLEAEIERIKVDESFLRDHLSISVKENRRLEMELLDSTEKLAETQSQITKLQTNLENVMKDKFGDLDPGSADFLLQEERIKQLRSSYEAQCRELQDRIDELQSELQEFQSLDRVNQPCGKPLSEELESKSPGTESDPGIGSDEGQPFSMSLEAEMMLEQLKEQHRQEMEELHNQLESKMIEFDQTVEKQRVSHGDQKAALILQHQQEVQALKDEMFTVQSHVQDLQNQLKQAEQERTSLAQKQADEKELKNQQEEEEVGNLRQQLLEAHAHIADLEDQLNALVGQQSETDEGLLTKMEELRNQHAMEITALKEEQAALLEARLAEERKELQEQKAEFQNRLLDDWEREKKVLEESHKSKLEAQLEEVKLKFEEEQDETVKRLTEQWQKERAELDEQNNESLQVLLEKETLALVREQEEKESKLREQWERERAQLQEHHAEVVLDRIVQERLQLQEQFEQKEKRLKEAWERERLQLEEDYEEMIQDRLNKEKEKLETEEEERIEKLMAEERARLEESHRVAVKKLVVKHAEERDALSATLDKLREDVAQERKEVELSFTQRIREVEGRFSDDQESVAKRFQADVLKLEEHYQSELKALFESHAAQKLHWEAEMQKALESAEEQREKMEKMEQDREQFNQEWEIEQQELENVHSEEMEALKIENKQLQNELDEIMSMAQRKEIELSMQLNELYSRLQEKHELLAQSESKTHVMELLLNQTVEDFKQERAELLSHCSELGAKHEKQVAERTQLLTERGDLRTKVEELEVLLKQAAVDFELEREELQESLSILENELKTNQEVDKEKLREERDVLKMKINELEMKLEQFLAFEDKAEDKEMRLSDDANTFTEEKLNAEECSSLSDEETSQPLADQDSDVSKVTYAEDEGCKNIEADHNTSNYGQEEERWMDDNQSVAQEEVQLGSVSVFGKERDRIDYKPGDFSQEPVELCQETCDIPESLESYLYAENRSKAVSQEMKCDCISSLEAFVHGENKVVFETCSDETKPQVGRERCFHEDYPHHEAVVGTSVPEETGGPAEHFAEDAEVSCLPSNSHDKQEVELVLDSECDHENLNQFAHDRMETQEGDSDRLNQEFTSLKLQALYNSAIKENVLLLDKVTLLQQKTEILENLLAHHSEKIKSGHQALEENYNLKVQTLLLMEHVKELEMKTLKMTDLQVRYEECACENSKLKDQNRKLETRACGLEGRVDVSRDFQDRRVSLADELGRMGVGKGQLFELLSEAERQDANSVVCSDSEEPEGPTDEALLHLKGLLQAGTYTEDCCKEFEEQNAKLRRAIVELQDQSLALSDTTQAHRSEVSRLAQENVILRQNIAALKEGDLKEAQDELMQTLEDLKNEKFAAQQAADNFKKQISELNLQSHQLDDENGILTERNAQKAADMESLRQQLDELIKESERREAFHAEEKNKMAACVSALEAELTKALRDTAQLEERNVQLSQELSDLREKMKTVDESLLDLSQQTARLKSDLRVLQQERDSLKHEISVLHKQLQNASDENHLLERTLHSSGLQNHSKKLYREEMSRLMEQELLRQENKKLQAEVHSITSDLIQSREKVRQLDATVLSLNKYKQQSQSSFVKALEQENTSLKQELEAERESCEAGQSHTELESLQQENEALKTQMARLSSQLMESFQAQYVGRLPPSPHRVPRGQHRGEDPDNLQDERQKKMKNMEERMKEIELSLRNVKLLLKEKVVQLKDQLHRNGKADVLIKDLYVENAQLLKALEFTGQRQKLAEKKNYLLEEKISSLNKIVRDLNPSTYSGLSYNYK